MFFSFSLFEISGFSDPYCMLGIQPGQHCGVTTKLDQPPQPSPPPHSPLDQQHGDGPEGHSPAAPSGEGRRDSLINLPVQMDKLKKHSSSFRLSFKRKDSPPTSATAATSPGHRSSGGGSGAIGSSTDSLNAALLAAGRPARDGQTEEKVARRRGNDNLLVVACSPALSGTSCPLIACCCIEHRQTGGSNSIQSLLMNLEDRCAGSIFLNP